MASISSISNSGNAWAAQAAERKAKLFAKTDTDGSGGVDSTELQTLMDKVSERTGVANTSTATDLMTKLDSNGDGTLDATELQKGIPSIVPLPSTMDFAQARSTGSKGSGDITITTTVTTTVSGSSDSDGDSDAFASLDTDGNGQLSKAEFDAAKPHGAGGPPPGGPPPAGAAGAASSSDSTVYDPLDTNKDGIVSAAEAAAGAANGTTSTTDTLQALLKAIDTDKDGKLSSTEADAFAKQVSTAVETLQKSSSTSTNGTDRIDINQLAQQVLKQYADIAAGLASKTTGTSLSVSA